MAIVRPVVLAIILALPFLASAETIKNYSPCSGETGYGTAIIHNIRVSPCPEANMNPPSTCVLKRYTDAVVEMDFTPTVASTSDLTVQASYSIFSLPGLETRACMNLKCPLIPNKRQTYKNVLPIKWYYFNGHYDVKWTLEGGPFKLCLMVPVRISG